MVTFSVFCNLKEPLLVRFITIAHTVISHNMSDFLNISVCITLTYHCAHFVPTDSPLMGNQTILISSSKYRVLSLKFEEIHFARRLENKIHFHCSGLYRKFHRFRGQTMTNCHTIHKCRQHQKSCFN